MTHDEMIAVIQAHKEGKVLQSRCAKAPDTHDWIDDTIPSFDFGWRDYRVKPEPPKPREWWLNVYADGSLFAYHTKEKAESLRRRGGSGAWSSGETIHVREVEKD